MRLQSALTCLFIGAFFVYLAIFGLTGFGSLLSLPGGTQNFTSYTKVDSAGRLTVSANRIDVTNMLRGDQVYVYKDAGAGSIADIKLSVDCSLTSSTTASLYGAFFNVVSFANTVGAWLDGDYGGLKLGVCLAGSGGKTYIMLQSRSPDPTMIPNTQLFEITMGTTYSLTFQRTGTTVTLGISQGATSLTTLTIPDLWSGSYRYLFVAQSAHATVNEPAGVGSGFIQNLVIGGSVTPPPGTATVQVIAQYYDGTTWLDVPASSSTPKATLGSYGPTTCPATFSSVTPSSYYLSISTTSVTVNGVTYNIFKWDDQSTGTTRSGQVTVAAGDSPTFYAYYSATSIVTPPPGGNDWLAMIKAWIAQVNTILMDVTVRSLMMLVGAVTMGVGFIGLVPSRKPQATA